ncbi:HlyD family secretion protein [Rahnella sp. SAP-1]|uniref:HlyD family secretion protein n=1 Tax=Rouxiella aceris TaxID=2703884 RepID=A0A848MKF9_9GAMM|nr:HlyD family secretion protein [Rouxiella aceris]NMP27442.1 HlyD family secretion protein [Rouxiella aceris]
MKHIVNLLSRYMLTLSAVTIAIVIAATMWKKNVQTPWTRDGRVRANVVQVAPDVSGPVSSVAVHDNQFVHRGDVLYSINPQWLQLAVLSAQALVEAKRHEMLVRQDAARRRGQLQDVISREDLQQTSGAAGIAIADYQGALAALGLAKLNLNHATIHAPVDGYVTNLRIQPGDYATAGVTKVAVLDAASFWIIGYFEETKLQHIHTGDPAQIALMGFKQQISGHVESIGHGIDDKNDSPGDLGLPNVDPIFSWVRLAQRIPVHIQIDHVPNEIELVSGMTASVEVNPQASVLKKQ